ncbi:MAG: hypothetical protein QM538_05375 [Methylacidiphilales bacterium]|nr:hypothetical protein [Candidatus Methylacidiphilales bacterium]
MHEASPRNYLWVPQDELLSEFDEYIKDRKRILFSGRFGIGKSTFVQDYFKNEKYKANYFVVWINPNIFLFCIDP